MCLLSRSLAKQFKLLSAKLLISKAFPNVREEWGIDLMCMDLEIDTDITLSSK